MAVRNTEYLGLPLWHPNSTDEDVVKCVTIGSPALQCVEVLRSCHFTDGLLVLSVVTEVRKMNFQE